MLPSDFYSRRLQSPVRDFSAFAGFIGRFLSAGAPARLLDVGVGRGDVLRAISAAVPGLTTFAVDIDPALARAASSHTRSLIADVECALPCKRSSLHAVVLSFVLHLLSRREPFLAECRRVAVPGGLLFILTATETQLAERFLNRFFPSLYRLDSVRYPTLAALRCELEQNGFRVSAVETLDLGEITIDRQFVRELRDAAWSSFALLDEPERREGLLRLDAYLEALPAGALPLRSPWRRCAIVATAV